MSGGERKRRREGGGKGKLICTLTGCSALGLPSCKAVKVLTRTAAKLASVNVSFGICRQWSAVRASAGSMCSLKIAARPAGLRVTRDWQ